MRIYRREDSGANARGTYRKVFYETTAAAAKSVSRTRCHAAARPYSPTRRPGPGKPLADAQRQLVADLAIGLQLLLAIALGAGGIVGRPVFHVGRERARQFQRLVMRLRRQRDDEVEIEPFPVVQFLERGRLVAGNV